MNAHVGDPVALVVEIPSGTRSVSFEIRTDTGEAIETLPGKIASDTGIARAEWVVDIKAHVPPLRLKFDAVAGKTKLSSGELNVDPTPPVVGPVQLTGGTLGDQHTIGSALIDDTVTIKTTINSPNLPFMVIDRVIERVPVDLSFAVEGVDSKDFTKPTGEIAKLGSLTGVRGDVSFAWKVAALGVPVVRLRIDVSSGGKLIEKRFSTVVWLLDWVDLSLKDPDFVDPIAREAAPRAVVDIDTAHSPSITDAHPQPAWAQTFGRIDDPNNLVGGAIFDANGNSRSLFPHVGKSSYTAQLGHGYITWVDVKKGSSTSTMKRPFTPRTKQDFLISSRLRISMWTEPAFFLTPVKNPNKKKDTDPDFVAGAPFTSAALDVAGDKAQALDDFTMLNTFTLIPDLTPAEITARTEKIAFVGGKGPLNTAFWRMVVAACHAKGIQVLAGYSDIITNLSKSRLLNWLGLSTTVEKQVVDFANELVAFLSNDIPWDGADFDIEHLPTKGGWSTTLKRNVRTFFETLANGLFQKSMLLSIAGATYEDHTHVAGIVPITGSATGLPFTLGHLSPNLICRPMGYDNGYTRSALRDFHKRVTRFALSPAVASAGLHPSQFQMGVKIFKGTNNGPPGTTLPNGNMALQGYMTNYPDELRTTCHEVLRPHRTGLIIFAWGLQPQGSPNWDAIVSFDEALNCVEPQDTTTLSKLVGVARFPRTTLGQPLQGALDQAALDRLK